MKNKIKLNHPCPICNKEIILGQDTVVVKNITYHLDCYNKDWEQPVSQCGEVKKEKDSEKIAAQAVRVVASARKPIKSSIYSLKLIPSVYKDLDKLKKISDENQLKREITKKWDQIKKKNGYKVDQEISRVIVESAVKAVGGKD